MTAEVFDHDRRSKLCNRGNADRVAVRAVEATGSTTVVVRTTSPLQPFRVVVVDPHAPIVEGEVELEVRIL